jgi:hypothetical protein
MANAVPRPLLTLQQHSGLTDSAVHVFDASTAAALLWLGAG